MSRGWVWPVLLAVAAGVLFLAGAARRTLAGLPGDTRAAYGLAWRKNRRPIATAGVALAWTTAYALYAISLPLVGDVERLVAPGRSPRPPSVTTTTLGLVPLPPFRGPSTGRIVVGVTPTTSAGPGASTPPTSTTAPTPPAPCNAAAASAAVRQVQIAAEALTGRALGADIGLVVEALAGCGGDPANAALALLGPVYALLTDLGIPMLALPPLPPVEVPRLPEEVAAPFRSTVFPLCAEVTAQLVTVSAVAPVARLNPDDVFRVLHTVLGVCRAFAPESSA